MKRKSKSGVKKSSEKKVIESNDDSISCQGLMNKVFDNASISLDSPDTDKNCSLSSQDSFPLIIDETTHNEFSQDDLSNCSIVSSVKTYIFVQLKLISVDASCLYDKLKQNFLCISSDACASHLKSFIYKKMNVSQSLYDVSF